MAASKTPPSKPKGKVVPAVGFRTPPPLTASVAPMGAASSVDSFVASGQPATLTTVATAAASAPASVRPLPLAQITRDPRAQPREQMSEATVAEYRAELERGAVFPPVVVFFDGDVHWLADGFHRLAAAERAKLPEFPADVRRGTLRDAILFSVGANASHGLRRTNEDKRRAVFVLLRDPEWSKRSDRWIGQQAAVHHDTVGRLRVELEAPSTRLADSASQGSKGAGGGRLAESASEAPPRVRVGRDGRAIKTDKIGKGGKVDSRAIPTGRAPSNAKVTDPKLREFLSYFEGYAKGQRDAEEETSKEVILRTPQNLRASTEKGRKWLEAPQRQAIYEADQLVQYLFMLACGVMNDEYPDDLRASLEAEVRSIKLKLGGIAKDTPQRRLAFFLPMFHDHVQRSKRRLVIYRERVSADELPSDPEMARLVRAEIEKRCQRLIEEDPAIHAQQLQKDFARTCPDDGAKLSVEALTKALRAFADDASDQSGGHKTSKYKFLSEAIASTSFPRTWEQLRERIKDDKKPSKQAKKAAK